jgi:hypothetical protein
MSASNPGRTERRAAARWAELNLPSLGQPRGSAAEQQHIQQVTRPHKPEHVGSTTGGEQLQMFMTPREIHAKYQGLDSDVMDRETWEPPTAPRTGESIQPRKPEGWEQYQTTGGHVDARYRTSGGGKAVVRPETHEQMWARKLEETMIAGRHGQHYEGAMEYGDVGEVDDPFEYLHTQGTFGSGSSGDWHPPEHEEETMHESIQRKGVLAPVHLGTFGRVGSQGKREIVGGHHRIAAATDVAPDQPIPVMHHEDIWGAKQSGRYS